MLNPRLDDLPGYPFARLRRLIGNLPPPPGCEPVVMSIGEPQHNPPPVVGEVLARAGAGWGKYPPLKGTPEFRKAITDWLTRRFRLPQGCVTADENVLPVAGTREAIYMFAQVAVGRQNNSGAVGRQSNGIAVRRDESTRPLVLVPNPLYHVYAGAALMAGADPVFVPATQTTGFLPDYVGLPDDVWNRVQLVYLCAPTNPQGMLASPAYLKALIAKVMAHGAILAVDECYSEIYDETEPTGALEVCATFGAEAERAREHVIVFNSLSKRSSAPGLRSGFAAGGTQLIAAFARLRDFASTAMPLPIVEAATELWRDETHVIENRARYRAKFKIADRAFGNHFGYQRPAGGFFLWLDFSGTPWRDGEAACRTLWQKTAIRTLPGAYLCPAYDSAPGQAYLRVALVHDEEILRNTLPRFAEALG